MTLDPQSDTPLYIQIKEDISRRIQSGEWKRGAKLPSERELSLFFSVSRMTLRQALQELIREGIIFTRTGKGNYAAKRCIDQSLGVLTSFSEEMLQRGMAPSSRVVNKGIQLASAELAGLLSVNMGTELVFIQRIRLADSCPVALETCYLIHSLCPGILDRFDFETESLYRVLREVYNHPLNWARQTMKSRLPTPAEQKLLQISNHVPVLHNTRITFTTQDQPLEYVNSTYVGEQFQLTMILR